jgi:hypothetical protein
MATPVADTPAPTLREKAADAVRTASHLSHEARLLKTMASDAIEDGVHAARRAATVARRDLQELQEDAIYRIKRSPLASVGVAFAAGVGVATAFFAARALFGCAKQKDAVQPE